MARRVSERVPDAEYGLLKLRQFDDDGNESIERGSLRLGVRNRFRYRVRVRVRLDASEIIISSVDLNGTSVRNFGAKLYS